MGDVVPLPTPRRRVRRRLDGRTDRRGEIALFTGVRIEHWSEVPSSERSGEPPDPRPRSPRRRDGR